MFDHVIDSNETCCLPRKLQLRIAFSRAALNVVMRQRQTLNGHFSVIDIKDILSFELRREENSLSDQRFRAAGEKRLFHFRLRNQIYATNSIKDKF